MSRTLVDIPEDKLSKLDLIAKNKQVSRAFIIRSAIDKLLQEYNNQPDSADKAFGLFKSQKINSLELQRHLREDWK
ncbi:MAG: hypothetical protein SFT91_05895 [Rickettsiaceae bacterium]|nr:hypothetical protein [Rickettsiaceae bacterium]